MAKEVKQPLTMDPWKIISYPLLSEKAIAKIETENKLVFVVNLRSNKKQIKWAVEKALDVKVENIRTMITQKGKKKAFADEDTIAEKKFAKKRSAFRRKEVVEGADLYSDQGRMRKGRKGGKAKAERKKSDRPRRRKRHTKRQKAQ